MFKNDAELSSVKLAKLAILERPFPQAIAGVPQAFGFDEKAGVFTLKYSTTLASGRAAPKGLQTRIHIPALHYPDGYQVFVQGGRVVSSAKAKTLLIEADPGTSNVELSVSKKAK
jgi:endoglycosylceramidase